MTDALTLVPSQTDADIAAGYRGEVETLLKRIAEIMNEADARGINIGFGAQRNNYGRFCFNLEILKRL